MNISYCLSNSFFHLIIDSLILIFFLLTDLDLMCDMVNTILVTLLALQSCTLVLMTYYKCMKSTDTDILSNIVHSNCILLNHILMLHTLLLSYLIYLSPEYLSAKKYRKTLNSIDLSLSKSQFSICCHKFLLIFSHFLEDRQLQQA